MVKKSDPDLDSKPVPPLFDSRLADSVKDSAQQIWLAGMGAFAKAQAEGTKMFESLVKDGVDLQRKTQSAAEERFADVADKMSTMASEASSKAGASWGKLENIFEERTAKALGKLGVPTAREVAALTRRVDELTALVAKLEKPAVPAGATAPAKAAAKPAATPDPAAKVAPKPAPKPAKKATTAAKVAKAVTAATPAASAPPASAPVKKTARKTAAKPASKPATAKPVAAKSAGTKAAPAPAAATAPEDSAG